MLRATELSVRYGKVRALSDATLSVGPGEIVALLGPNGAGKSTALKAVSGVLDYYNGKVTEGTITFCDRDITGVPAHQLIGRGLAVVAEGRRVFHRLTVLENLELGGYTLKDNRSELRRRLNSVLEMFPHLKARLNQLSGTLSGGEQQMLVFGRALMSEPKLLVADEPSVGLSPNYVEIIFEQIKSIGAKGVSILMAEQNARMALETSDRAYVFGVGRIESSGPTEELLKSSEVQRAFFGG